MIEIRRAGDVTGTPDWQLDRMYETDTAAALEKAYAEPDITEQVKELEEARRTLDRVVDNLLAAEDAIGESPLADKIRQAMYEVQDIDCDVGRIIRLLKGGAA